MINQIVNNVANARNFILGAFGNNALARLADVNKVVNAFNNLNVYRNVHFGLSSNNNSVTFESFVSGSSTPDCVPCSSIWPSCVNCNAECERSGECGKNNNASLVITGVAQLAVGVYELTLNPNLNITTNPRSYGMFVSQLEDITHQVQISKIVAGKIKIETFISGVPSGLVLRNTPFIFNLYPYSKKDL